VLVIDVTATAEYDEEETPEKPVQHYRERIVEVSGMDASTNNAKIMNRCCFDLIILVANC
jgi:hypothetical protein